MNISGKLPYADDFDGMAAMSKPSSFHGGLDIRVICSKNIPARDPIFEYVKHYGEGFITALFESRVAPPRLTTGSHLQLFFPENYLTMHEQRVFPSAAAKAYPNLKRLDIVTHSLFIVQLAGSLSVIQDDNYYMDNSSYESGRGWWFQKDYVPEGHGASDEFSSIAGVDIEGLGL